MKSRRLIIIALFLILVFSASLAIFGYALRRSGTDRSDFSRDEFIDKELFFGGSTTDQSAMRKKFAPYTFVSDDGTVTFFSDETVDRKKADRVLGKREYLTYDEVLYIINDTYNLYMKYDRTVLTGVTTKNYYGLASASPELVFRGGKTVIENTKFDESDSLSTRQTKFTTVMKDVITIAKYRLYLLDTGLTRVYYHNKLGGAYFSFDSSEDHSDITLEVRYFLILDHGELGDPTREDYLRAVQQLCGSECEWDSPISGDTPRKYTAVNLEKNVIRRMLASDDELQKLFPTAELEAALRE